MADTPLVEEMNNIHEEEMNDTSAEEQIDTPSTEEMVSINGYKEYEDEMDTSDEEVCLST